MKSLIIAATLAGLAVASPLTAQGRGNSGRIPPGQMPRAGMCRVWIDGIPPGRQPAQTDCATARTQAAANGGRVIYGSSSRNREDCTYSQSTNSVGDIIFGRTNNTVCEDRGSRVDGGWYQVGRGANNNSIYERRTRDANGNLVIQRARRNPNGTFTILNTHYASDNDKQWRKAQRQQDKELRKEQKEQDKEWKKAQKGNGRGRGNSDRDNDDGDDDNDRG